MKIKLSKSPLINKPIKTDKRLYGYVYEAAKLAAKDIFQKIHSAEIDKGGLILVTGPQSSGKSLVGMELVKYFDNNGRTIIAAQPKVDRSDVPDERLFSRAGYEIEAFSFQTKKDIEKIFHRHDVVIIDEIQFVPPVLQSYLLKELRLFKERGGWAVLLGLLYTSLGTEFLIASIIKENADLFIELKATCQMCGRRNATYNQRLVEGKPASESSPDLMPPSEKVVYEPRCADCYVVAGD